MNLYIPYFGLLLLAASLLKHNLDEKNISNIDVWIHVMKWEIQNSMKISSHKWQTLEKVIKNIARAITMYHDHWKSNKSERQ